MDIRSGIFIYIGRPELFKGLEITTTCIQRYGKPSYCLWREVQTKILGLFTRGAPDIRPDILKILLSGIRPDS